MNRKTATLLSILGLLLILLLCLWTNRGKIQQDLTERSTAQLNSADFGAVDVALSGRDATLNGKLASKADIDKAVQSVTNVYGVRTVINNLTIAEPKMEQKPVKEAPEALPEKLEKRQVQLNEFLVGKRIEFDVSSAVIRQKSFPVLNNIIKIIQSESQGKIVIGGHTDSQGDAALNQDLSQRRAEAIRKYMISRGIDPSRLTAIGYGESKPIASNDTREGREKNRRVEFNFKRN